LVSWISSDAPSTAADTERSVGALLARRIVVVLIDQAEGAPRRRWLRLCTNWL
jgi:hypothetical protein